MLAIAMLFGALLTLFAGCTASQPAAPSDPAVPWLLQPAPDATTPVNDPRAIALRTARGIAAPACAIAADRLDPDAGNVVRRGVAVATHQLVGVSYTPANWSAVMQTYILNAGIRAAAGVLASELATQVGDRLLKPGTTAHAMTLAFLVTCGEAMGPTATLAAPAAPQSTEARALMAYEGSE